MRAILGSVAVLALLSNVAARADDSPLTGSPSGQILVGGVNRVMILSTNGAVVWEYPAKLVHDAWMLADGNVLFADGETVTEVTRAKEVVFQYKSPSGHGDSTYACQRLANGNTMVAENATGKILEVTPKGEVVFSLQTAPFKEGDHHNLRMARKLESGHYLVCHSGAKVVKEYTPEGRVVWESKQPGGVAFAAVRTARGTTLASSLDQVIEYDASGAKVWELRTKDLGVPVHNLTGMHLLPNGNLVLGCYSAYKDGAGCGMLEVSREGRIVWRYSNPKADACMMAVQMLSPTGRALESPCWR